MFHIAIVDDDTFFIEEMRQRIQQIEWEGKFDITCFSSAKAFLAQPNNFDILLLDIDMPEMTGIQLAKQLRDANILIIYITNCISNMEDAFGINVFKFIVKENYKERIEETLLDAFRYLKQHSDVKFLTDEGMCVMKQMDIVLLTYYRKNIYLRTRKKEYVIKRTSLEQTKNIISKTLFVQVNRDTIVNKQYIKAIRGLELELINYDKVVEISRRRKEEVFDAFMEQVEKI